MFACDGWAIVWFVRRAREEDRESIDKILSGLSSRDRSIVVSRFGLDESGRPRKFREIAERLNISTERVRQLLARSLHRLRDIAEREPIELE